MSFLTIAQKKYEDQVFELVWANSPRADFWQNANDLINLEIRGLAPQDYFRNKAAIEDFSRRYNGDERPQLPHYDNRRLMIYNISEEGKNLVEQKLEQFKASNHKPQEQAPISFEI